MVLESILNLWSLVSGGMQSVYNILNTTLRELLIVDNPIVQSVITFIISTLGYGDWTVLDFMFGVGLPFLVGISITKWFIDILP